MSNGEFYPLPKKIEFATSLAKWSIQSEQSVLVLFGFKNLNLNIDEPDGDVALHVFKHVSSIIKKAKSLAIPIVEIESIDAIQSMQRLGEYVADQRQMIVVGQMTAMSKQLIQHIASVAHQLCVINDAIVLDSPQQHIQWLNKISAEGLHHMNTAAILRLWSLSAPTAFIRSEQGIILAIAEYLDMEVLEIDPYLDLRQYGLDSIAMVSLIGLWRANGAQINYEVFLESCTLAKLIALIKI